MAIPAADIKNWEPTKKFLGAFLFDNRPEARLRVKGSKI